MQTENALTLKPLINIENHDKMKVLEQITENHSKDSKQDIGNNNSDL